MRSDFTIVSPNGVNGWNASVQGKVGHGIGLVADFSGYYSSYNPGCSGCTGTGHAYSFLFGPQISFPIHRVAPFGHFLLGDTRASHTNSPAFSSNTCFSYAAGGGLDYWLAHRVGLRVQADWLHTGFNTQDNQLTDRLRDNVARISTGVVFRF